MKTLVLYKYGNRPKAIMAADNEDEIKTFLLANGNVEINSFWVDKTKPANLGTNLPFLVNGIKYEYYLIVDTEKFQKQISKPKLSETEIPAYGKRNWNGGAWVIVFVYSNKGNFVLKGFMKEVQDELDKMNIKYFANFSMWSSGKARSWWKVSTKNVYVDEPSKRNKYKWELRKWLDNEKKVLRFKRLPKRWIPEIENF